MLVATWRQIHAIELRVVTVAAACFILLVVVVTDLLTPK